MKTLKDKHLATLKDEWYIVVKALNQKVAKQPK